MVELTDSFETNAEDVTIAVGMRKDDARITQVNEVLATISEEEQIALMDDMIENQPVEEASEGKHLVSSPKFGILLLTTGNNFCVELG